ncbi:MAG: hypothetical protein LC733_06145 [Actinobacteria bacterium]|nr:hypothetical protein [Actinomycetota bacterium]
MADSEQGTPDLGQLLKQAQAMQEQFLQAKAQAAEAEVEAMGTVDLGPLGGGLLG